MKKILLTMITIVSFSLVSCEHSHEYKAEGERMANRLDELCQKQDAAAAIALDDSIRALEQKLVESSDTTNISDFRNAVTESQNRNAPIITRMRVQAGATTDEAVQPMIDDALNGDGDITTITKSINEGIKESSNKK